MIVIPFTTKDNITVWTIGIKDGNKIKRVNFVEPKGIMAQTLIDNYQAKFIQIKDDDEYYGSKIIVIFSTEELAEQAIDWIESYDLIKKMRKL